MFELKKNEEISKELENALGIDPNEFTLEVKCLEGLDTGFIKNLLFSPKKEC